MFAGSASNDLFLPHLTIVWPVRKSLHSCPVFIIIHFFQARRQPQGPSKAWEIFSSALKNHLDGQDAEEAASFPVDPTTTTEPKGMSSKHQLAAYHICIFPDTEPAAHSTAGDDEVKSKPSPQPASPVPGEFSTRPYFSKC